MHDMTKVEQIRKEVQAAAWNNLALLKRKGKEENINEYVEYTSIVEYVLTKLIPGIKNGHDEYVSELNEAYSEFLRLKTFLDV